MYITNQISNRLFHIIQLIFKPCTKKCIHIYIFFQPLLAHPEFQIYDIKSLYYFNIDWKHTFYLDRKSFKPNRLYGLLKMIAGIQCCVLYWLVKRWNFSKRYVRDSFYYIRKYSNLIDLKI